MSNEKQEFYLGIDLGTTNTVMSYGKIAPNNQELKINSTRFQVRDEDGGRKKVDILPSCVYFKKGEAPIIGPFAKGMLATQGSRVVNSIKSKMGENYEVSFDKNTYKPEDVSGLILKYIANLAEKTFKTFPEDVVITVPASFSSDQKKATIEAARQAGFKVTNEDGSPRNILLNEPRAALFNFVYEWKEGKVPEISLDEAKNILVFDLGGGTLDVSLHKLDYNLDIDKIDVKDYAISRYTKIGGDDFDFILSRHFKKHLEEKGLDYEKLDEVRKLELDKKLIALAEKEKIELNNTIFDEIDYGSDKDEIEELELEILKSNVYDNIGIDLTLETFEYRKIIKGLLGNDLKLDDYNRINEIDFNINNNIIYPILDVMAKTKKKLGKAPKVDAVLLNGGMSKLYFIQERIEELFGFKPISATDEDKAVAFGATYYHHSLHKGIKYGAIQNESIGIETKGGFVKHLINAGDDLPCSREINELFEIQENGATTVLLPFYLGEREDTKEPNKKIALRRIIYDKPLIAGNKISLKVDIDEAGLMNLVGWKEGEKENPFEVKIESSKIEILETVTNKSSSPKKYVKKVVRKPFKSGPTLDVTSTTAQLRVILNQKKIDNSTYKNLSNKIKNSMNGYEFINILFNLSEELKNEGRSKIIILLGDLIKYYDDYREDVTKKMLKNIEVNNVLKICDGEKRNINRIIRDYVNLIGKGEQSFAESTLLLLFNDQLGSPIKNDILVALGKCGYSKNTLLHLLNYYNSNKEISTELDSQKLLWALAKLCSREKENPIDINPIYMLIDKVLISLKEVSKKEIFEKLIFLLGEMCDSRFENCINEKYRKDVLKDIELIYGTKNTKQRKLLDLIKSMVSGNELDKEQEETLLAIRTTL